MMTRITGSESIERCFGGAFKNNDSKLTVFVKVRNKRGYMKVLTQMRRAS
jgi:hypothetical protein